MKKRSIRGFVLADSLVALLVVALGIATLLMGQKQLAHQERQHRIRLCAARLAKEATDQQVATKRPATIRRGDFRALAQRRQVTVWYRQKMVVTLR
ncbi:hypothetical protein [Limosilactobacillus sp.]|uniref:hypothetical protein n=1 Tax=Limosilactobacillus sp. TaxID=2773925 RepID=UPI0025C53AA3|nr:hypothetical protein [Limosilactobacillus sp.]MCH3922458.1 hypothetical protein [Limosilactobacillus sp.]MCH3927140.1 hypothetical protein [Limosilactobacillus sp.]